MDIIGGASVFQGDCFEVMPTLPAGSIDLILSDLPYGVTACSWDVRLPFDQLWREYERLLTPNGAVILTATQPFTTRVINSKPEWFRYELIWRKNTVTGFLNAKKQPLRNHENVIIFSPAKTTKMVYHPQGLVAVNKVRKNPSSRIYNKQASGVRRVTFANYPRSVMDFNSETDRKHPSQKPVSLMMYLIQTFSNPGAMVLDSTMGSGSTGVAALQCDRRFIGIELDPDFYETAVNRLSRCVG